MQNPLLTHECGKLHHFLVGIRCSQRRRVARTWDHAHTNVHALTTTMTQHSKYSVPLSWEVRKASAPYKSINPAVTFTWHNTSGNICQMCGIQSSVAEVGKRMGGRSWVPGCKQPSGWDFVPKGRKRAIFVWGGLWTLLFYFPDKCHS